MQEPLVELKEVDPAWDRSRSTEFESQDRERNSDTLNVRAFKYGRKRAIGSSRLRLTGHILFTW